MKLFFLAKLTLEAISDTRSVGMVGIETVGLAERFSANILRHAFNF